MRLTHARPRGVARYICSLSVLVCVPLPLCLQVLKEQLRSKMATASSEKRAKIEAQLARLERNLAYVEEQRVGVGVDAGQGGCGSG